MKILVHDTLREVEVSISNRCSLACKDCGFFVPNQPNPSLSDGLSDILYGLEQLKRVGFRIASLGVLGGEPTLSRTKLEAAVTGFRALDIADRIEVVSNGLTPQGLSPAALRAVNRLTVSVYGYEDSLLDAWMHWVSLAAPHVELVLRRNLEGWDPWTESRRVSPEEAQGMYNACWYRKHCITLERGRLFPCSRVPKLGRDEEGLLLTSRTTLEEISSHLHRPTALRSCADCTPMMGLPTVPPGIQPDNRIELLQRRAVTWLQRDIQRLLNEGKQP